MKLFSLSDYIIARLVAVKISDDRLVKQYVTKFKKAYFMI